MPQITVVLSWKSTCLNNGRGSIKNVLFGDACVLNIINLSFNINFKL